MISIEAWRSVVGGWSHRAPSKKQKITHFLHMMWESLHVRSNSRSDQMPEFGGSVSGMMKTYWGTLLLLLMKVCILHSVQNHLTLSHSYGTTSTGGELMQTAIPAKLVMLLLLIAGIERNPGPLQAAEKTFFGIPLVPLQGINHVLLIATL